MTLIAKLWLCGCQIFIKVSYYYYFLSAKMNLDPRDKTCDTYTSLEVISDEV